MIQTLVNERRTLHVMAGLVPAIHVLLATRKKEDVDARDKRGDDESRVISPLISSAE
jgi:hypothetical protein